MTMNKDEMTAWRKIFGEMAAGGIIGGVLGQIPALHAHCPELIAAGVILGFLIASISVLNS